MTMITNIGPATRIKLLAILNNPAKAACLQIELAAIIDAGTPLVKATYNLEGLVLTCYETVCIAVNCIHAAHHPNVRAVAERLVSASRKTFQQWNAYANNCMKVAQQYFTEKINGELSGLSCKAVLSIEIKANAAAVDSL